MEPGGAVIRQGAFTNEMQGLDWLHSPASVTTMAQLLTKYDCFFSLMAINTGKTAVHTLDMDLSLHTHQLSPRSYYCYSISKTAGVRYINHDDKIGEDKHSEGIEWTTKQYEKEFNEIYSKCACWHCEGKLGNPIRMLRPVIE
jgi:hypothetical protein